MQEIRKNSPTALNSVHVFQLNTFSVHNNNSRLQVDYEEFCPSISLIFEETWFTKELM